MISVQKVNHFTFFIIKHRLNDLTFCYPFCQNALPDYISQKKHSYEDLGNNASFNLLMIASSLVSRNSLIFSHSNFKLGSI
ncbi:hypothetical protein ECC49_05955 [Helicobacter pylori]|nr:hypothetical protein ECC49_05955 [Helicobacter pylori]